jgi:hypothetical protein
MHGVPALPTKNVLSQIIAIASFVFCVGEPCVRSAAGDSPGRVETHAGNSGGGDTVAEQELAKSARELKELSQAQGQAKAGDGQEVERLKKQLELQQKQIDVLLRMTQLLAEQVRKPTATGAAIEKLQEQVATEEAHINEGAQRDLEAARAHDDIVEQIHAASLNGPWLPSTLREIFSPTRNNESPLAIYGTVAQAFDAFSQQNTSFRDQSLELRPYLLLNEKWLMSANVALQIGTVQLWRAQLERFINDNLTFVAGRFYSPIGFYSERLRLNWVIKTPDPPLMFNQVYPQQLSFDGLQLRGARYLFDWPVKLEYAGFVANGLSVAGSKLTPSIYSNLNNFTDQINDVNGAKAYGGRVGVSLPGIGFIAGLSGLANQAYDQAGHNLSLWDVDASYHRGNWDARFELAKTDQQTPAQPIHRFGFYTQVAYRQYNNPHPFFQKLEGVFRFDHVQFDGINLQQTGINFGGLGLNYARQPLDRNRFTFGVNYWFYPSLVLKLAIEINDELGVPSLRDNGFLGQLVWGW